MRVIAGSARGRPLKAPRGTAVRPTTDRVREAMFSSLAPQVPGARVLDLFAGTGALGIEALSRGAHAATFVERDPGALAVLNDNLRVTGLHDQATVVRAEAGAFVSRDHPDSFTLVLCDPPYDVPLGEVLGLVVALDRGGGLAADATVVVERDKRDPALAGEPDLRGLLAIARRRSYGDTVLLYLHRR
jgi:16S rRNA (guanine966-N2)-methyltransferase